MSTVLFLANSMSLLICALLIGFLFWSRAYLGFKQYLRGSFTRDFIAFLLFLTPLFMFGMLRAGRGDITRSYLKSYYINGNPIHDLALFYDFFTYHFNFKYNPDAYRALAPNIFSIPFLLLVAIGAIFLIRKSKKSALIYLLLGSVVIVILSYLEIFPLGGVRHSFLIAPLAYVLIANGVEAFKKFRYGIVTVSILTVTYVVVSADYKLFYNGRIQNLKVDDLRKYMKMYNAEGVLSPEEATLDILRLKGWQKGTNAFAGFRKVGTLTRDNIQDLSRFLIVGYRHTFNCNDECQQYSQLNSIESRTLLDQYNIRPLMENTGTLPIDFRTYAQNIYYPINGAFIYLAVKS